MIRTIAAMAMVAMVGCADTGAREGHDEPTYPVEAQPEESALFLADGPATYDVVNMSDTQRRVVREVMLDLNKAVGFEAFAADMPGDGIAPYGIINIHMVGCRAPGGYATWNLAERKSTICVEWSDDREVTMNIIAHELLHTLDLGHDDDATSIMRDRAGHSLTIKPHHIAHVRKLAGLE